MPKKMPFAKLLGGFSSPASKAGPADQSPGGVQAVVRADATAVGENATASSKVTNTVADKGPVTIGYGQASSAAAATSPSGSPTYTSADTSADVSGADLVLSFTDKSSSSGTDSSTATSSTRYFALNVEGVDLPMGPLVVDHTLNRPALPSAPVTGTSAVASASGEASGQNTYASTDSSAVVIADEYASAGAIAAVGVA